MYVIEIESVNDFDLMILKYSHNCFWFEIISLCMILSFISNLFKKDFTQQWLLSFYKQIYK